MNKGKLSLILGIFQIVCVTLMFYTDGGREPVPELLLLLTTVLLIISSATFSTVSFWRNERPIIWAVAGLGISIFWIVLMFSFTTSSAVSSMLHTPNQVEPPRAKPAHLIKEHYVASPERQTQILDGIEKLKLDMSPSDVKSYMGDPDETRMSYRLKDRSLMGYEWWFIVEQKGELDCVRKEGEKLVLVSFKLNDKLDGVGSWGIEWDMSNWK